MAARLVTAGGLGFGNDRPLVLISGPCQIESRDHAQAVAGRLAEICRGLGIGLVFKASFDKANRSQAGAARGVGIEAGLEILAGIGKTLSLPILTDVHECWQVAPAAEVADILQIPAFLCRQTDLLQTAGRSGRAVNIKKGQFLAPAEMAHAAAKVAEVGNHSILLTERGTSFGYNGLVVDPTALVIMARTGYPVIMDATHAVQTPGAGGPGGQGTGGRREFVACLARAAVSLGIAGLFLEAHDNPDRAPSDGANMIALADLPHLLQDILAFDALAKSRPLG